MSEKIQNSETPPRQSRISLGDILRRSEGEPSATDVVLQAADIARRRIDDVKLRAETAEANLALAQEELSTDPDTGLWTERKFNQEVDSWVHREGANPDTKIAIVYIDMNGLKRINDTLGHDAGDEAIRDLAKMIKEIADSGLRADDFRGVSRSNVRGDEFILALPAREHEELHDNDKTGDIASTLSQKINALVQAGHENSYYASGFVVTTRERIIENGLDFYKKLADEQMYKNKKRMKDSQKTTEHGRLAEIGTHHI